MYFFDQCLLAQLLPGLIVTAPGMSRIHLFMTMLLNLHGLC